MKSNVTWAILTNEVAEKAIAQPDQMTYVTGSRGLVTPAARHVALAFATLEAFLGGQNFT